MSQYYSIVTNKGLELFAQSLQNQTPIKFATFAVGSGLNNNSYEPDATQTALKDEKYRGALSAVVIAKDNPHHVTCELLIPAVVGGFYLREAGLFSEDGTLIAVAKIPPTYKAKEDEGSTAALRVYFFVEVANADQVVLHVDEISQIAVENSITTAILEHEAGVNHPYATATSAGLVRINDDYNAQDVAAAASINALQQAQSAALVAIEQLSNSAMPFHKQNQLANSINLDDVREAGFYWIVGTDSEPAGFNNQPIINGKPNGLNGALLVIKTGGADVCVQLYFVDYMHEIHFRHYRAWLEDLAWQPLLSPTNINDYLPAGIPQPWPQSTPPRGWLVCDGSNFSGARYPLLAAAYPACVLPDLRGEFIRGLDFGRGVDVDRAVLSLQEQQIAAHKHVHGGISSWGGYLHTWGRTSQHLGYDRGFRGGGRDVWDFFSYTNDGIPDIHYMNLNPAGLVGAENRPRNVAFLYIVRAA